MKFSKINFILTGFIEQYLKRGYYISPCTKGDTDNLFSIDFTDGTALIRIQLGDFSDDDGKGKFIRIGTVVPIGVRPDKDYQQIVSDADFRTLNMMKFFLVDDGKYITEEEFKSKAEKSI